MRDYLKAVLRLDNIPLTLAIIISLGFLIYDLLNPTTDLAPRVIIAVLGILAFGLLAERLGYLDRMEQKINDLSKAKVTFLRTPTGWADFEDYCESAKDIFISGGTLYALLHRYADRFEEMARRGCRIRIILLNPDNAALPAVAAWAGATPDRFKRELENSHDHLREILQKCGSNLEVRLNSAVPALTIMGFDPEEQGGRIRVDLNLHKCLPSRRQYFELTRSPHNTHEDNSYQGFLTQFNNLWQESEPWAG
jgi:hypothetical protein